MKMLKSSVPFAFAIMVAACFYTGCSDTSSLAGTAEEPNELAKNDIDLRSSSSSESSSSVPESSSSIKTPASSATSSDAKSSSSVIPSSSSISSSSSKPEPQSSSSKDPDDFAFNSSASEDPQKTPAMDTTSLEYYIAQFGLVDPELNNSVLASRIAYEISVPPPQGNDSNTQSTPPTAQTTEFDVPWPAVFVKQNIYALEHYFPAFAKENAALIDSIAKGTASDSCKLYMQNTWGNSHSIGHFLGAVTRDTVIVYDIAAGNCTETTQDRRIRFLFRYCGEFKSHPEIVHITLDAHIPEDKCPVQKQDAEWYNER